MDKGQRSVFEAIKQFLVGALLFVASSVAMADDSPVLVGYVTKVIDGDTLDIQLDSGPIRIRLHGIDAPEKAQAFGTRSKQSLSALCFNKTAKVDDNGTDRRPAGTRAERGVCSPVARREHAAHQYRS